MLSLLKQLSVVMRVTFLGHASHTAFFHLFQNMNPHETKSFAHFVAQLSLDSSQKVCSIRLNNS